MFYTALPLHQHIRLPITLGSLFRIPILLACTAMSLPAAAQFADDFSVNSIRYSSESFSSGGETSTTAEIGGIRILASSDGSGQSRERIRIAESSDSLAVDVRFDPESLILDSNQQGFAAIRLDAAIYNDQADGGPGGDNRILGEVYIEVSIALDGSGNSFVGACLGRQGENGFEGLLLFDGGNNNCTNIPDVQIAAGDTHTVSYALDRTAKTLIFGVDDNSTTIELPGEVFTAAIPEMSVSLTQENGPGSASAIISRIMTDTVEDEFSSIAPIVARYEPLFDVNGTTRTVSIENQSLKMRITANVDSGNSISLRPRAPTDYLEALVTVEDDSDFSVNGMQSQARLQMVLFNDIADGGADGRLGDVRAELDLALAHDGTRRSEVCLRRIDDADGNNRTGLLENGRGCIALPVLVETGTAYRMAIGLDRSAATVTFKVNGLEKVVPITTDIFAPSEQNAEVLGEARNNGTTVLTIDDVRTSPSALTAGETATGLANPPGFPDLTPLPTVSSTVESEFDFNQTVGFTDDFSSGSTLLGYDAFPDSASASLLFRDNAIELQVSSNEEDPQNGAGSALQLSGATDSIRVNVSLSSRSTVAIGDAEASFDLESVFYNDTTDGGVDGSQEGDIETKIRLRLEGNGRRLISAEIRRRDADGNSARLALFDGDDGYRFNGFVPQLDTVYELAIELDRENRLVTFSVDDMSREIQLPTEVFLPARRQIQMRAWQRGLEGRAVARIHSWKSDTDDISYMLAPPVLPVYRPSYETRGPNSSFDIEDERLKLIADSTITDSTDPRLVVLGKSDYVAADIELSSESTVADGSDVFVDVSGLLYNDVGDEVEGSLGAVFVSLRLKRDSTDGYYVETCAFRSNDAGFNDVSELIGGLPDGCPRLGTIPQPDTSYPASIALDRSAGTLTYMFADESFVYSIPTGVFQHGNGFNGVRAHASSGSRAVAFADDLSFSEGGAVLRPVTEQTEVSSGSSSGCSIGSRAGLGDPMLLLLIAGSLMALIRRRQLTQGDRG